MTKELNKDYNHLETTKKWQEIWEKDNIYKFDETKSRQYNYVIDTPPPTVSGMLHMGHVFSYTQADFIARFQRMKGKNVFYPMGFDDNGLPTERLVEKIKNVRASNMERSAFVALCQEVVQESEEEFRKLFRSIGLSVDWSQEYQTISAESRTISQMSFIDLYNKEKAYRTEQPTLWDPADQTSLAQVDIVDKEQGGTMFDILFKLDDNTYITIATTRPELLPACQAVMYHPNDERYKHLAGKYATTPLFDLKVPLIADEMVDKEKGTGLVMCCTFGDITDMHWWRTHKLNMHVIIDKSGRIYNLEHLQTPEAKEIAIKINGAKAKEAKIIIRDILKEHNLLTNEVEVRQVVKCAERSGCPLEIIATNGWYIKILDAKERIIEKARKANWRPDYMKQRLEDWARGLNWDWCISRQRFFGVPFPVWYSKRAGEEGKILIAAIHQLPIDPLNDLPDGYSREEVIADLDVMDTWATSSVTPQLASKAINAGLAIDYKRHERLYPADLRPQAHEIIRSWAFYTIVKSLYHEDSHPWNNLMISGWCLAADKTKMSKSKGNIVTPTGLIEEKSADVVRYWASTSKLGTDIAYSEETFKIGKKLVTKLWNASKFAGIHLQKIDSASSASDLINQGKIFCQFDLWLISKLYKTIEIAEKSFDEYEYFDARSAVEEFFWKDFCDNYLEIIKKRAYNQEGSMDAGSLSAAYTIHATLSTLLRLFAPFIPFVTEELHAHLCIMPGYNVNSVHEVGSWPILDDYYCDENVIEITEKLLLVIDEVRKYKSSNNLALNSELETIDINKDLYENISEDAKFDLLAVNNAKQFNVTNI